MLKEYNITVDFADGVFDSDRTLEFVQGDHNTHKFIFNFENEIEDGNSVLLKMKTDQLYEVSLQVNDNQAEYLIPNTILNSADKMQMSLTYIGTNNEVLTNYVIKKGIRIKEGLGDVEISDEEVSLVESMISTMNATETSIRTAENLRVDSEDARETAETARETAESTRQSNETTRISQESARVTAESSRTTAETARASAETTRQNNETTRETNEIARQTAETARASAETTRASAETSRASAETTRGENETVRQSAEMSRQSNETSRTSAESSRATAESARGTAETARASAETSRASAESSRVTAENSRVSAEEARATAETARVNAESARAEAEIARAEAEEEREEAIAEIQQTVSDLDDSKVDKVTGKGLSTEDYTTAEKTKLAGIEAQANKTIVDNALDDTSTNPVQNKVLKGIIDAQATEITNLKNENTTLRNQIPTGTASGTSIDLDDSSDLEFEKFKVEGKSTQITTTGAQLFDKDTMGTRVTRYIITNANKWSYSQDSYSIAIPCEPNKTYALSHSVTTATIFRCGYIIEPYYGGNADIAVFDRYIGTTDLSHTIQTGENATYIIFQANASAMPDIIDTLMLNLGETALPWEPYSNGVASPSPDYPQPIYSAGDNGSIKEIIASKNNFNINGTFSKSNCNYSVSGNSLTLTATSTYGNVMQEITNLKGNKQYRIQFEGDNAAWIRIQDSGGTQIGEAYNSKGLIFITPANGTIRVRLYVTTSASSGTRTFSNIQLERGSVATDYTAYQANQVITIPCQQPMRSIGNVRDEFVKVNGAWYERHNITYIASYNGETITTDYMSTTGGLDTGASVQYVASTPTDIQCTEAQIAVLESLKDVTSYRNITHIYTNDTNPAYMEVVYRQDLTTLRDKTNNKLDNLEARVALLED